jgi:uncharacterized protein (DUF2062 family)
MFQRKTPHSPLRKIREMLWPSMGWKRALRYGQLRLVRLQDSTRAIAVGLAFGASISFTPLPGVHIVSAVALTLLARGNALASVAGTVIGNPWTFPLMWWAAYQIGDVVFLAFGADVMKMPDHFTWNNFTHEIAAHPTELIVPWVSGGMILMAVSWPLFYIVSYRMVHKLRQKYRRTRHG